MTGPHSLHLLHAGRDLSDARVAMLLVHGRGGTARDILSLAGTLKQSAYAYVAPQATGNTWYPLSFLAPTQQNEPYLSSALRTLDAAMQNLQAHGIPPERVILAGFSQGACLTLEYAARQPKRYGALIGYSGGRIGPPGVTWPEHGSLDGTPVLLGCSDVDPHIPVSRVHETADSLARLGAVVDTRIYPGMGHTINEDELNATIAHMQRLAAGTP